MFVESDVCMVLSDEHKKLLDEVSKINGHFRLMEGYTKLYEKRNKNSELIGLCGIIYRHKIFKSCFLWVKTSEQGKGYGKALFEEMWLNEKVKPFITTTKSNIPALRIYSKYYFFLPYFSEGCGGKVLGVPKLCWWFVCRSTSYLYFLVIIFG